MQRLNTPDELEQLRQDVVSKRDSQKPCITICAGTGCLASGARDVV